MRMRYRGGTSLLCLSLRWIRVFLRVRGRILFPIKTKLVRTFLKLFSRLTIRFKNLRMSSSHRNQSQNLNRLVSRLHSEELMFHKTIGETHQLIILLIIWQRISPKSMTKNKWNKWTKAGSSPLRIDSLLRGLILINSKISPVNQETLSIRPIFLLWEIPSTPLSRESKLFQKGKEFQLKFRIKMLNKNQFTFHSLGIWINQLMM